MTGSDEEETEEERRHKERRHTDRRLKTAFSTSLVAGFLATIAAVVSIFVGATVLIQRDDTEQAVCSLISYAEEQSDNVKTGDPTAKPPRPANPKGAKELDRLANNMRKTGIGCPPRAQKEIGAH